MQKVARGIKRKIIFGFVAVSGLLMGSLHATPDIDRPATVTQLEKNPSIISVAEVQKQIVPHRALYALRLASIKNGSNVSDIGGKMYYSWADDCTGWNIEQKMQMQFFYSEGEVSSSTSSLVSREAKDGSSYVYHIRRKDTDNGDETARGTATLNADTNGVGAGEAVETGGKEEKKFTLSATTFPAHHTLQILAHAKAGKKFFALNVFDGADENGLSEISSFIGGTVEPPAIEKAKSNNINDVVSPLTRVRGWPVRMAFFAPTSKTGSPNYEMDMVVLENGIIKTMTIEYEDFTMAADLISVEALPASKCGVPSSAQNKPKS